MEFENSSKLALHCLVLSFNKICKCPIYWDLWLKHLFTNWATHVHMPCKIAMSQLSILNLTLTIFLNSSDMLLAKYVASKIIIRH